MRRLAVLFMVCILPVAVAGSEVRRCIHPDGTVELRDRACPPGTERRPVNDGGGNGTFSTVPAVPPPQSLLERASRSIRRAAEARGATRDNRGRVDAGCSEHERRVEAINRRLRKGYSVGEGNELRAERRRIRRYLRDACR